MRFSVNVSMLFTEVPLVERFGMAAAAGFEAVESWWPEDVDLDVYADAVRDESVHLALLNLYGGQLASGDRGVLGDLARAQEFREAAPLGLELAASLGCQKLHALVGKEQEGQDRTEQLRLAVENVRWVAGLGAAQRATILVEPLNRFDNGPCLIQRVDEALAFVESVGRENVAVQFDSYHVARTEGALSEAVSRAGHRIGHVQLADVPGRGHPGSGEIDFDALLGALADVGYDGYLGLEHLAPSGSDADLAWLPRSLRAGDIPAGHLRQALAGRMGSSSPIR